MKPVSVILPTLNEGGNILLLIQQILQTFDPLEILVVDDHSSDGTVRSVRKLAKKSHNVVCIENNPPLGLAQSLQKGISKCKGTYVAWMDADFSHPPDLLSTMYETLLSNKADVVVASWLIKGGKDKRKELSTLMFSYIINRLCQLCFGTDIHAYTSGYIFTKRSLLQEIPLREYYGEYCINFLVRCLRNKKKIIEVPFVCVTRFHGISKTATNILGYFITGRYYIFAIIRLLIF